MEAFLSGFTEPELISMSYDWDLWARPTQQEPAEFTSGAKQFWLCRAGRGWGKTRVGAEQVRKWIKRGHRYVNLIGATSDDVRDIMVEGESGILAVCPPDERPIYKKHESKLVWPNGAISLCFTAVEPQRLRGKQHQKLWADELAAWRYAEAWEQAMFGLRLPCPEGGPQAIITTTPTPAQIIRELSADPATFLTLGTTYDNAANLDPRFYSRIVKKYEGTRLGRQELEAELLLDTPGALWKRSKLDEFRISWKQARSIAMRRVVVAVDPAVSTQEKSNETGIVGCGLGQDQRGYVMADLSGVYEPAEWARRTVELFDHLDADVIIAEANQGGELVRRNIQAEYPTAPVKLVHASRGKYIRAEPISTIYEQGRVSHIGTLSKLEDQMCVFTADYDRLKDGSPDRVDALVWGFTELFNLMRLGSGDTVIDPKDRIIETEAA